MNNKLKVLLVLGSLVLSACSVTVTSQIEDLDKNNFKLENSQKHKKNTTKEDSFEERIYPASFLLIFDEKIIEDIKN